MEYIFNNPVTVAAFITGSIGIIGILIQISVTIYKNKTEEKTNFEIKANERLEKIYNPLLIIFNSAAKEKILINEDALILINKYGHLLQKEIFKDINNLIKIEQHSLMSTSFHTETSYLRNKIWCQLNSEFDKLTDIQNKNFDEYIKKQGDSVYTKLFKGFIKFAIISTIFNFTLIVFLYFLNWISKSLLQSETEFSNNVFLNTLFGSYIAISLLISIIFIYYSLLSFPGKLLKKVDKIRGIFTVGEFAPVSGKYQCRVCKEDQFFYENQKFNYCKSKIHTKKLEIQKIYVFMNLWKRII